MLRAKKIDDLFLAHPSKAYSLLLLILICRCPAVSQPTPENRFTNPSLLSESPTEKLPPFYDVERILLTTKKSDTNLPMDLNHLTNYEMIRQTFTLSDRGESLLTKNGFVVIDGFKDDDMVEAYKAMKERGIPIFITSDSLLHLFHVQFNHILMDIEQRELLHQ